MFLNTWVGMCVCTCIQIKLYCIELFVIFNNILTIRHKEKDPEFVNLCKDLSVSNSLCTQAWTLWESMTTTVDESIVSVHLSLMFNLHNMSICICGNDSYMLYLHIISYKGIKPTTLGSMRVRFSRGLGRSQVHLYRISEGCWFEVKSAIEHK